MSILINAATVTEATKVVFILKSENFENNTIPAVKTVGLGIGDVVSIFEKVNGSYQLGKVLDVDTTNSVIQSVGEYAVDIVMTTAGPASVSLDITDE